jgi:hypothetical protein
MRRGKTLGSLLIRTIRSGEIFGLDSFESTGSHEGKQAKNSFGGVSHCGNRWVDLGHRLPGDTA